MNLPPGSFRAWAEEVFQENEDPRLTRCSVIGRCLHPIEYDIPEGTTTEEMIATRNLLAQSLCRGCASFEVSE